jgi:BAH domain
MDMHDFWVAKVLEIRALDAQHVYVRVVWYYWPDELPSGRSYYHGKNELIASNHMEIIDAMTVTGRAHVQHWQENDEEEEVPGFFWRQKYHMLLRSLSVSPSSRCIDFQ